MERVNTYSNKKGELEVIRLPNIRRSIDPDDAADREISEETMMKYNLSPR